MRWFIYKHIKSQFGESDEEFTTQLEISDDVYLKLVLEQKQSKGRAC